MVTNKRQNLIRKKFNDKILLAKNSVPYVYIVNRYQCIMIRYRRFSCRYRIGLHYIILSVKFATSLLASLAGG